VARTLFAAPHASIIHLHGRLHRLFKLRVEITPLKVAADTAKAEDMSNFDCVFTGKGAKCVPVFPEFHPAGVFLLWALQKTLSGGSKARAETLSVKECKI
jgi:hypothetical protein